MKPQELKAMIENHSEHRIDNSGNVYLKVKRGKRYTWGDAPVCNILEMADEAERLMKENEDLRGYNAQCDLIAVENARLWKKKIDSLLDWAALWKRKAKELYRVMSAFDEEHASIVASNMRLANENGIMRAALETTEQACSAPYLVSSWDVLCLARSALEKLERGE